MRKEYKIAIVLMTIGTLLFLLYLTYNLSVFVFFVASTAQLIGSVNLGLGLAKDF